MPRAMLQSNNHNVCEKLHPIQMNVFVLLAIFSFSLFFHGVRAYAEEPLPDTLKKIKPSIVAVGTYLPSRNPRGIFMGTGFAVGNGHLIVTNAHVIPEELNERRLEKIAVFYQKKGQDKIAVAEPVSVDKKHDLALLKITEDSLPAMKIGTVSSVEEGRLYAFTGFPIGMVLGFYPVTHRGIISAITPNIIPAINPGHLSSALIHKMEQPYNVFQLDATAYPGNSGSPLYDPKTGEVIGIINKVFIKESKENALSDPSGITYAIPANHIEDLLNAIKSP